MIQKVSFRSMNNQVESRNKLMVYDFSKHETGVSSLLCNACARESLRGNNVAYISFELTSKEFYRRFNDANSNVENIMFVECSQSTAVKSTYDIYNGEMVPFVFELFRDLDTKADILIIDSADFLVGTDIINKLINFADTENIDIYTAIRNKSRLPNVWEE